MEILSQSRKVNKITTVLTDKATDAIHVFGTTEFSFIRFDLPYVIVSFSLLSYWFGYVLDYNIYDIFLWVFGVLLVKVVLLNIICHHWNVFQSDYYDIGKYPRIYFSDYHLEYLQLKFIIIYVSIFSYILLIGIWLYTFT